MATIYIDLTASVDGNGDAPTPRNVIPSSADIATAGNVIKFKRATEATVTYSTATGESSIAYRYLSGTNCYIGTYYNSDGSDDETKAKPIITPIVSAAESLSFFRFNSAGTGFTCENIIFKNPVCSQVITCSNGGGSILINKVEIYNHLQQYTGAASSLTTNSIVLGSSAPVTSAIVRNCIIDGTNDDNLVFGASTGLIENCIFKRPGQGSPSTIGDNISCSLSGAHLVSHSIRNNKFYIEHASVKQCYLHNTSTGAGGGGTSYVEDNEFYLNSDNGASTAVAISVGQTDATGSIYRLYARRNKIYNANIAIFAVNGDIQGEIESNLILLNKATPSVTTSAVVQIANTVALIGNTIVNRQGSSHNSYQAAVDMNKTGVDTVTVAKNNLIMGWLIGIRKHQGSNPVEDYNSFYDCVKNVTRRDTDATVALGAGSITTAPLVNNAYVPSATSPLVSAGTFLKYKKDYMGQQYINPPSIGAYEYKTERANAGIRGTR